MLLHAQARQRTAPRLPEAGRLAVCAAASVLGGCGWAGSARALSTVSLQRCGGGCAGLALAPQAQGHVRECVRQRPMKSFRVSYGCFRLPRDSRVCYQNHKSKFLVCGQGGARHLQLLTNLL